MSTLEDLDDMEREGKEDKKDDGQKPDQSGDAEMKDADGSKKAEEKEEDMIDTEILHSSTRDIQMRRRLLDNDMRIMKSEYQRLTHEQAAMKEKIKDNLEKIVNNRYVTFHQPAPFRLPNVKGLTVRQQTIAVLGWKCRRASGLRCGGGSGGRRRQYRSRCYPSWPFCSYQNLNATDHFPSPHRPRRPFATQTWRPHRCEQRLVSRPRYTTGRI